MKWFVILLLAFPSILLAEILSYKLNPNLIIQAEFIAGEANSPVVILIPPFLQTNNFYTTRLLGESLAEAGLNVLLPTLSYGISLRKNFLDCAAIHSHSILDDAKEINYWVNLMAKRSHKKVILLGHSFGATQVLHTAQHKPKKINKVIMLSLGYFGLNTPLNEETTKMIADAKNRLKNNNNLYDTFSLSFCKKYITTPKKFLSYTQYDKSFTLNALTSLTPKALVVMGEKDERIGADWINLLAQSSTQVKIISNASHFFDNELEFSLFDVLESFLELD